MKTISRLRYFIYLSILIVGCTTGKNALQKGNYNTSVVKAVNRLQNSPQNKEAREVLASAYELSLAQHLRNIDEAKMSSDVLRWESVISAYEQINQLSNQINSCPACLTVVPNPQRFIAELADSKFKAAAVRYALGVQLLNAGDKLSARKAYQNFERTQQLYANYKDTQQKINEAYNAAVLKVVVQPARVNSEYYQEGNEYFQQRVSEWMNNYQYNKFVIFYDERQASKQRIVPDQIMRLRFDDFVVGQTYVKERVEKLAKDSVKIGESRASGPIYGTVKATLSIFDKKVASSGLLDMTVIDYNSNKVVRQRKLTGTYVWEDQWASYKGDERALTKHQLAISKRKEVMPPSPGALFVEFTKPIYSQLISEISSFYNNY
ncbi:hypothetical protein [Pedobacter insulae]|uniref:Lipoprotein n=1 Tax=Pedobacter insulae TaxID=414048 RepID=A0A1I2XJK5_9SPHI|nr:hypothetical protein [Pedobacter insulae]SFH13602.1 hypothetical protein SAMN04489864_105286 [Pedobacter insulae]